MDALAGLSFAHPIALWLLLLLVPAAVVLVRGENRRRKLANRFVSERLRGQLLPARKLRPWFIVLGSAAAVFALAGPQYGAIERTIETPDTGLVVLLDTSLSMDAVDVGTSRLAASRAVIQKVLDRFDGRAGLVVFEGSAEVVAPLTEDTVAISSLLDSVGTGELEVAGSNLRLAITAGLELLDRSNIPSAVLLLISDGEHRAEELGDVLEGARDRKTPVVTVMIGTPEGSTIPTEDGSPLQARGETIITRARENTLVSIASSTGGRFFSNPFSEDAIAKLGEAVASRARVSEASATVRIPKNRYQVPLSIALGLLLIGSVLNRGSE